MMKRIADGHQGDALGDVADLTGDDRPLARVLLEVLEELLLPALVDVVAGDAEDSDAEQADEHLAGRRVHQGRGEVLGLLVARGAPTRGEREGRPGEGGVEHELAAGLGLVEHLVLGEELGQLPQGEQDEPRREHPEQDLPPGLLGQRRQRTRLAGLLVVAARRGRPGRSSQASSRCRTPLAPYPRRAPHSTTGWSPALAAVALAESPTSLAWLLMLFMCVSLECLYRHSLHCGCTRSWHSTRVKTSGPGRRRGQSDEGRCRRGARCPRGSGRRGGTRDADPGRDDRGRSRVRTDPPGRSRRCPAGVRPGRRRHGARRGAGARGHRCTAGPPARGNGQPAGPQPRPADRFPGRRGRGGLLRTGPHDRRRLVGRSTPTRAS